MEEKKFLNDREFTKAWIDSRAKRGYGLKRIRRELALKGVDKTILEEQIGQARQLYSEEDTLARMAEERWRRLKGLPLIKAKQRLFGYLIRRGFSPDLIIEIVGNLTKNKS